METTNDVTDVGNENGIKNNQPGTKNENVACASESSTGDPVTTTISGAATDSRSKIFTPNVPDNQSKRDTESAACTAEKKEDSSNDDATHKPGETSISGTTKKKQDSPNDDATHNHGETSYLDIQGSHSDKSNQNDEDTSESRNDDKGNVTITESTCHGKGSSTNVPDIMNISPGEMDNIDDRKDTAGKSNSDTENIVNENAEVHVSENRGNFSNPECGSKIPKTPDADIKSKISWNDKMKTQAVIVVLVLYGILILLLLYLVIMMKTPVPPSPIPIPGTPEGVFQKISAISRELNDLKLEILTLNERIKNQETNIQRIEGQILKLLETVEDLKQTVEYLREKLPFLDGKLKWMEQEQTEHGNYILLFLVIFLLIFLGVIVLIMRRKDTQPSSISTGRVQNSDQFKSKVGGRTHTSVLDQIHPIGLEKRIGIVSFNNKTQKIHKEMLQRALNSMDINTEIDVVLEDREDKIPTIKPSRLVFIFVDRNDRNIILEDPESEIGNLRRITTQSFMKMGSTVVVVYVNDRESRNLDGRDLYNPLLQSVKRHTVLKELQAEGRVFSVMDNFNQNQNEHIKELLKKSGL